MDEKGFMKGIGDDSKVLVPVTEEEVFSIQPGNREWVSVIKCISTNGYSLPAFIIFQGQRLQQSWVNLQMDKQTVLHISDNGWTTRTIALEWLKHFDQYTLPQTRGKYRLLILDGHTSHVSLPPAMSLYQCFQFLKLVAQLFRNNCFATVISPVSQLLRNSY
jgi:hypothetical protein